MVTNGSLRWKLDCNIHANVQLMKKKKKPQTIKLFMSGVNANRCDEDRTNFKLVPSLLVPSYLFSLFQSFLFFPSICFSLCILHGGWLGMKCIRNGYGKRVKFKIWLRMFYFFCSFKTALEIPLLTLTTPP